MKKSLICLLLAVVMTGGCKDAKTERPGRDEVKEMSFTELFDTIDVKSMPEDVFTLVGEDYGILTAGAAGMQNSMVTSWGGWGVVFGKPGVFHFLRSNRYTLELMRKQQTYSVSFFDREYRNDIMLFGMISGRDSNKMKETKLTAVQTPDGIPTYKEAKIILECRLVEVTSVSPGDFYNEEDREFVTKAYSETGDWHKIVFGQITKVWIRKNW